MNIQKDTGVLSNTTTYPETKSPNSSTKVRPYKIQKLQIPPSNQIGLFTDYQPPQPYGEGTSNHHQSYHTTQQKPADSQEPNYHNKYHEEYIHTEEQHEDPDEEDNDPFFYYQDDHVQESIDLCNNSVLGKILADKHIPSQVLFNSLAGIWGNPAGFKINELENKILQFKMDKEEDTQNPKG